MKAIGLSKIIKESCLKEPFFETEHGALYDIDCMEFLKNINDESVDTVFADPPFNIKKNYGEGFCDNLTEQEYLEWCFEWISESVRILKPGGAFFLYNLPKWNMKLGSFISGLGLEFRHWIAISMKVGLPIQKKLYPSHYSLLYFTKGKPNVFQKIRTPIEVCRHCGGEIKDYGGHRKHMNPEGVSLTDIWVDIPPVRHRKYKSTKRKVNALSSKILDRVVEVSTLPGDIVVDPFGGSGTTYAVCEKKHRHWLGTDIYSSPIIKERLCDDLYLHVNSDFVERVKRGGV